jgi:hypothetical protein
LRHPLVDVFGAFAQVLAPRVWDVRVLLGVAVDCPSVSSVSSPSSGSGDGVPSSLSSRGASQCART